MSTAVNKIKNIVTYLIPSAVSNILPIFTFPILTRFLTPEDFGISALAMATVSIIVSLVSCNMTAATQRYFFEYRSDPEKLGQLINSSLMFLLVVFVVTTLFLLLGMRFISKIVMGSAKYSFPMLIAYAGAFLGGLVNFYLLLYRNMEKAKDYSFFTVTQMLINISLTLIMAVVFKMGYLSLIYPLFISSFIV